MELKVDVQMKSLFQGFNKHNQFARKSAQQFLFHLDDVCVSFGKIKALNSVSLTINPKEIVFVTGKSGAGKSTLLNILAGDLRPDKGRVLGLGGSQLFVSQVFQDLKLLEDLSVEENLWYAYDKSIYKNKKEFQEDLHELANVLGLSRFMHLRVMDANGGLKQKVAMIRALLTRPNVLIADEPTCALDRESAQKMFEVLNFYNLKRNLTVIWASHNRELVKDFPGKIIHLENGKLIYSGHACFI
tara:strand:- start:20147 stop:20878 length:732 start_codon:yes stop_codon:yes gene_type:complete